MNSVKREGTISGDCIHADLHRKEGDDENGFYGYHRAGESMPGCSLEEEWSGLVMRFLSEAV